MKALKILVVDDDEEFAEALTHVLELNGHTVETAVSGEEAVRKFRDDDFDITFLDVKLPGMNGLECFMQIRRVKPTARVIMMTGFSVPHLLDRAVENGAWAVLRKPLDIPKMLSMLEAIQPNGVILIADDDPAFVEVIENVLQDNDYTVLVARDGREAVERIRARGVDVLILDLRLPVMNGLEVYLQLKREGRVIPTMIVTGYATEDGEALDKLRDLSVSGILVKPFDPETTLEQIATLVS